MMSFQTLDDRIPVPLMVEADYVKDRIFKLSSKQLILLLLLYKNFPSWDASFGENLLFK